MSSNIREDIQNILGFDFNFHIQTQYFQAGVLMSGNQFLSNNNVQGHLGYGFRKEGNKNHLAVFAGITYFTGVIGVRDSALGFVPKYYDGAGVYFSAQAIRKITYDIGGGLEFFGEYNQTQRVLGLKFILFFSGAYKGLKKNVNPNVRSESGR